MKYQNIFNRLRRIEGQIRGIEEMVAKERSEEDLLMQLEAARSSLASTISTLIESMLKSEQGKVLLEERQVKALLRSIRR